jgi:hypothetical protein
MFALLCVGALAFSGSAMSRVGVRSAVSMGEKDNTPVPVKNSWVKVCEASELKPNSLKPTFAAGQDILVAVDKSGTVFATANVCPHIGTPLDQGKIKDGALKPRAPCRRRRRVRASRDMAASLVYHYGVWSPHVGQVADSEPSPRPTGDSRAPHRSRVQAASSARSTAQRSISAPAS